MKTQDEMQVLEAAANDGGKVPKGLNPRTVASRVKQKPIVERRNRGGKSSLVAAPAETRVLQEQRPDTDEAEQKSKSGRKAQPKARTPQPAPEAAEPKSRKVSAAAPKQPPSQEAQSKLGLLIGLLRHPDGATLEAMVAATGWQAHSVRGAMAGAIKKKLGLTIVSEKSGLIRSWRIVETRA